MPRVSKQCKGTIGRSLMKAVDQANHSFKPKTVDAPRFIHGENNKAEIDKVKDLKSCIDQDNLTDFLQVVSLENKNFEVQRGMKIKLDVDGKEIIFDANKNSDAIQEAQFNVENNQFIKNLRIPRKPKWTKQMSKEELNHLENLAFVEWRKSLAKIEETNYTIQITPFEKNIEVWKQLWRVIERSDIVVQIVDGRDPLFFRCIDVETYSLEVNPDKLNFLLVNKSDLMSDEIRAEWSQYFRDNNINHMFFSALLEQERIDAAKNEEASINKILPTEFKLEENPSDSEEFLNTPKIANRMQLLYTLQKIVEKVKEAKALHKKEKETAADGKDDLEEEMMLADLDDATKGKALIKQKKAVQVGMVGYPNVGKSSVINTLCNKKLVGVGSLPGKTKNYQTHFLSDDLILCDCPGLVFPNAASTRAEMVCNGVMPIDKLKDYLGPVDLLCTRVPKIVLEKLYKIKLEVDVPDGAYFLSKYAIVKGYYNGSAIPDLARSARFVLKEYVSGKLLYCKLPPTVDENGGIWQSNKIELPQTNNILGDIGKEANQEEEEEKAENMEALLVNQEEKKLDMMLLKQETTKLGSKIEFDEDDIVMLLTGKKINGIKLNKQQKRDIKHAYQRGEKVDMRKYLDQDQILDYGIKNKAAIPPSS